MSNLNCKVALGSLSLNEKQCVNRYMNDVQCTSTDIVNKKNLQRRPPSQKIRKWGEGIAEMSTLL